MDLDIIFFYYDAHLSERKLSELHIKIKHFPNLISKILLNFYKFLFIIMCRSETLLCSLDKLLFY